MSATHTSYPTLVQGLSTLLRNHGDTVLDGSSTITLQVTYLQHLTRLFEQYLNSRTNQHSFLALPSHPADTSTLLQVQFLFDMLQKTISLKLVHPPGVRLQSIVKIFPFKFLKQLELKRIPPHCVEGLHGIYSHLEVFVCSKSISSLKELLLLCGGDLTAALPWLELHTLNFSCNYISCLDESLRLLNVLKSLNLSHNKIQECAEFLKPLCELKHLNLAYNKLRRPPELGLSNRAKLVTLVLRHNQLESINGVEHLSSLQCLDLAYNLLLEHTQLAPLAFLHNLNLLALEGNPLYFLKTHRNSTMYHLSPQAALRGLQLDGSPLPPTELGIFSNPRPLTQLPQTYHDSMSTEQTVKDLSVGVGELCDSLHGSKSGARRKSKKVKVRTASISEPSNTECSSSFQDIVLCHQKDIEKLDSFREQMGEDWLRYQHHLHDMSDPVSGPEVDGQINDENVCSSSATLTKRDCNMPKLDSLLVPLMSSELNRDKQGVTESPPETESTLQLTDHSFLNTESTLDRSLGDLQQVEKADATFGEDAEDLGVDLCRPMLVRVLSEMMDSTTRKESEPLFLRVHQAFISEVDVHQGCARSRFELDSLRQVTSSYATWTKKGMESLYPVLELHFSYVSRERQKRRYLFLDDNPQEALQVMLELLSKIAVENENQERQKNKAVVWLQCLRCQAEFSQAPSKKSELDVYPEYQVKIKEKQTYGDAVFCPQCTSDHVIQLACQVSNSTSTLVSCDLNNDRFDYMDNPMRKSHDNPIHVRTSSEVSTLPEGTTDTFLSDQCAVFNGVSSHMKDGPNHFISSHTCDSQVVSDQEESNDWHAKTCGGSQALVNHQSCQGYSHGFLTPDEFQTVDHRLKLFLDVEVFEGEEEICCLLKMSVVKFGYPEEFPSLVVVSSQRIYILEVTLQSEGLFSDWLQKKESHRLCELSYLEVGLSSQSIHMEFGVSAAAYTLLIRDSARCKYFFNQLTTKNSVPKSGSKLKTISTTQLNPKHYLWPLVYDGSRTSEDDDCLPPFFYLLAFLQLGSSLTSVSVMATQETLFLLNEDHQWSKNCSRLASSVETQASGGQFTVHERQPVTHVSSINLFSTDPCRADIQFYDELAKEERTWLLRAESVEGIQSLINWIKDQWEAMFGVKLMTAIQ